MTIGSWLSYIHTIKKNAGGWSPIVVAIVPFCNPIVIHIVLVVYCSGKNLSLHSLLTIYFAFAVESSMFFSCINFSNTDYLTCTHTLLVHIHAIILP